MADKGRREEIKMSDKIAVELVRIAADMVADEDLARLRMQFPFHSVVEVLDDAYGSMAAYSNEKETPKDLLRLFKRTYSVWDAYEQLVAHYAKMDRRFSDSARKADKALGIFKALQSGRARDWKGGFVTLLARLKRSHEALYNIR